MDDDIRRIVFWNVLAQSLAQPALNNRINIARLGITVRSLLKRYRDSAETIPYYNVIILSEVDEYINVYEKNTVEYTYTDNNKNTDTNTYIIDYIYSLNSNFYRHYNFIYIPKPFGVNSYSRSGSLIITSAGSVNIRDIIIDPLISNAPRLDKYDEYSNTSLIYAHITINKNPYLLAIGNLKTIDANDMIIKSMIEDANIYTVTKDTLKNIPNVGYSTNDKSAIRLLGGALSYSISLPDIQYNYKQELQLFKKLMINNYKIKKIINRIELCLVQKHTFIDSAINHYKMCKDIYAGTKYKCEFVIVGDLNISNTKIPEDMKIPIYYEGETRLYEYDINSVKGVHESVKEVTNCPYNKQDNKIKNKIVKSTIQKTDFVNDKYKKGGIYDYIIIPNYTDDDNNNRNITIYVDNIKLDGQSVSDHKCLIYNSE